MRVCLLLLVFLAGSLAISSRQAVAADDRPNIIFLLTDDQSTWSLGCYGNADVQTPHIDALAADGMVFDRHYDTTAICMASRATVMTGLYEYRHRCNFDRGPLQQSDWDQSYPMLLRKAGYATAFAGKFGFLVQSPDGGQQRLPEADFDSWGGGPGQTSYETSRNPSMRKYAAEYPHSTRSYGAFGRDFIRRMSAQDRPYCLSISFKAPHKPDQPDPIFDGLYVDQQFERPGNFGRGHGQHFSLQSRQGRQYERFVSWGYRDRYDEVMAIYHRLVHGVDVAVGMIREAVEASGAADNTVIIFTSDNGFMCGSHGYGSKVLPYEEASRVPLIIYDPRHANSGRGLRCGALTGNIDMAPTILELARIAPPEGLDGRSLLPLYENPDGRVHDSLALINVWGPQPVHSLAVVTRDEKYVYWPYTNRQMSATEELYNLAADPLELRNLAANGKSAESLSALRAIYDQHLQAWRTGTGAGNVKPQPNDHGYRAYGEIFDRAFHWRH